MEKNEKGYPYYRTVSAASSKFVCNSSDNSNGNSCGNGSAPEMHGQTCGGDGSCLDDMHLAYVYAPDQRFRMLYSADEALKHGTLFEELYKPREVYGRE